MTFLEITYDDAILVHGLGTIISLLLLGITIALAVRVNRRERHSMIIIRLLASIAEKNGVDPEKLKELIERSKK